MARRTRESTLKLVFDEALAEFNRAQTAQRDERLQCLQDRRFYSVAGAQWEGPLYQQWENKPKLEVNVIHRSVIRIFNEWRNNRIEVKFINKDGTPDSPLADVCAGLYRADEQDSCAQEAYDNAFEEAVGGGFGAWRLRAEYEDEDSEREYQRIRIEPIYDADSCVFWDRDAKRQDKSDANHCWVLYGMTWEAFKREWGVDPATMPKQIHQHEFDWSLPNLIYIAEYYRIERVRDVEITFVHLDGSEEEVLLSELENGEDDEYLAELKAKGAREKERETIRTRRVHKYIMCGTRILEDCGIIAGRHIPIVPMYGKRWFVDGTERMMGQVRLAKDPQRIKNMLSSRLAEIASLSPYRKPIFLPEQITGHETMWASDNIVNYPYQLINPVSDPSTGANIPQGPVGYTEPPDVPAAMAALLSLSDLDMKQILGTPEEAEKLVSNISGKAVEMIQERIDAQAFIYMDNMAKAVKRSGEIWLSIARDVYVEEGRKMKSMDGRGGVSSVELLRPVINAKTGLVERENDITQSYFDVAVDVGPSNASRRAATVRGVTQMMQFTQDPSTLNILQSVALMNMEGEGLSDVNRFYRKQLVMQGVIPPTEEEKAEMAEALANQPPNAQDQYLQAAADQATAEATKARADTVLTLANAGKARADTDRLEAETVKTLVEAGQAPDRLLLDAANTLQKAAPPPA